ncbi:hypothetical protein Taro_040679 [Colocasia esculenta]|uniref:Amino acid transporter transmembrane domain-containing protein n=1 Tax=Colocasia esculenta TaxID=4460 RepID=A0A843WYW6_COLES|nr:hypothetical protein [Colocasia esculenta]
MGKEGTYSALPVNFPSVELQTVSKSDGIYVGDADGHDKEDLPLILDAGGATVRSDQEARKSEGSDVPGAVFNLATSVIGAGIMALPATMRVLGLALGLVCIALMGALSELSIELLVRSSVLSRAASYGDAVRSALGLPARAIAEVCIVVNNAGILIVYLIIIGDVMSGSPEHVGVLYQWLGDGTWSDRRLIIFITLVIFLAPLCALERIDSLSLTSAASVALAVVFVVVSCIIALIKVAAGSIRTPRMGPDLSSRAAILDLLVVVPIMTNAYVCHFNVQPIYNELRGRSPAKMNHVSRVTTVLCVAVYASTAVSGYLLFGDDTESDVLTNFDKDLGIRFSSALNYIVRVGYVLHLVLVFPVIHFSLRQTVGVAVFKGKFPQGRGRTLGLTAVLLALIYLGSTMIPNIWVAFKFTGATTGLSLGFIFPSLIALKLHKQGKAALKSGEKFFSWLMLVLAGVASVIGVAGNIYSIQNKSR